MSNQPIPFRLLAKASSQLPNPNFCARDSYCVYLDPIEPLSLADFMGGGDMFDLTVQMAMFRREKFYKDEGKDSRGHRHYRTWFEWVYCP